MTQLKNLPQLKQKMQVKNNALKGSYHDYCVSLQQQVPWFNTKRLGILESALIFFFFFFTSFWEATDNMGDGLDDTRNVILQ